METITQKIYDDRVEISYDQSFIVRVDSSLFPTNEDAEDFLYSDNIKYKEGDLIIYKDSELIRLFESYIYHYKTNDPNFTSYSNRSFDLYCGQTSLYSIRGNKLIYDMKGNLFLKNH